MSRVSVDQGVMMVTRQVDVYSPEPDTWGDGSWPSLRRMRLSHGCCVAPSDHGGVIITGGGSAEVGGAGHRDLETVEPGLPSECDCALCGPTDHIQWEIIPNKMATTRSAVCPFLCQRAYIRRSLIVLPGHSVP